MKTRFVLASSIILMLLCVNLFSIAEVSFTVYAKGNDDEEYTIVNSFYENFESEIDNWEKGNGGKWETQDFKTESKDSFAYEGKNSLVFSAKAKKPRQSALCTYVYDFSEEEFVIPLEENTEFLFAWYVPSIRFSYIGTFLLFSNGKTGYYVSQFYGMNLNKSSSYTYLFDEPRKTWIFHERYVYEDYEAVWGAAQDIKITGVGVILADVYGTGGVQKAHYDSLFIGTELEMKKEGALSVTPGFQAIYVDETVTYDIEVLSLGGYNEEITLEVSGLPEGADGIFEPVSGTPPFQSRLSIKCSADTPVDDYVITISALSGEIMKSVDVILKIYGGELKFKFTANPGTQVVVSGDSVEYTINLLTFDFSDDSIEFSIEGLPDDSTAEFSMNPVIINQANELSLSLIVTTDYTSNPGTYTLEIKGESTTDKTLDYSTSVILVISGSTLKVKFSTDKPSYMQGEDVHINGEIRNSEKVSLLDISVSIQVTDQSGNDIHLSLTSTDENGDFSDSFRLSDDTDPGTYLIFITASKMGYRNAYGRYFFVVGESSIPSIAITDVYSTDASDVDKTNFRQGETVYVVLFLTNGGADLDPGIIWVEVSDPNGVPMQVISIQTTIRNTDGDLIKVSFPLSNEAPLGSYTMDGYVSDKMISQGGKFLTHLHRTFQVI